ncbi:hypothetical protein M3231_13165 [Neobacillus mesonae]|nr:hypothetical protein [Neobacillus mesonae]
MVVESDIPVIVDDLDTLVKEIEVFCSQENWEKVIDLSHVLLKSAEQVHYNVTQDIRTAYLYDQPIIYYFGYSYLMTSVSYQKLKQFTQSIKYITFYSDLSWLSDASVAGEAVVQEFRSLSEVHHITLEILSGNQSKLLEFEHLLENNTSEVLLGLIALLESAIEHRYNIDRQLSIFQQYIKSRSHYEGRMMASHYLSYKYLLAQYEQLNNKPSEALCTAVYTLWAADKLNNDNYFKKAVSLFEALRKNASVSQLTACFNQQFH